MKNKENKKGRHDGLYAYQMNYKFVFDYFVCFFEYSVNLYFNALYSSSSLLNLSAFA